MVCCHSLGQQQQQQQQLCFCCRRRSRSAQTIRSKDFSLFVDCKLIDFTWMQSTNPTHELRDDTAAAVLETVDPMEQASLKYK
jgi:hypothetical protein